LKTFSTLLKRKGKETLKNLREKYNNYIVKPQRGGEGNNFYNEDILKILPQGDEQPSNMLMNNAIIMERIQPPEQESFILYENILNMKKCVTEYSIFGVLLSDEKVIHCNQQIGYFLRTKESGVQEGGLVSGFSATNLPYLI
jgi:hypothetical protein